MTNGLFQDGDLIRVIGQEGILLAGGGTASLLQTAHPKIAQGVFEHSDVAVDPLGRLSRTMQWSYAVVFGSREEAERLSALVSKTHEQVTGPGYRANDPDLQVWVQATLFAVAIDTYQAVFRRRLTHDELESYYQQSKVISTVLGCPPDVPPATYADFRDYYARMLGEIRISAESRAIAEQVLHPKLPLGRLAEPALAAIRLITAGLMPEPIRAQYGWPWDAGRDRRYRLLMGSLAAVYPRLPRRVRTLPRDYYLGTMRRRTPRPAAAARGRPRQNRAGETGPRR
ncbi:MAG TPA: oxygenase MpaB family protein [Streptosporangiaceae bacterium]|nr:oxygenase MpaB family protein [Streptosporangiaceae bacterium]